jgi:signal transduction histidine kinase
MYARLKTVLIVAPLLLAVLGGILAWFAIRRLLRLERETRALSIQLICVQEEERRSIARELHDEIGQWLSALRLEAGRLLKPDDTVGSLEKHLSSIADLAERSIEAVRRIALSLRPSMLDDLGLVAALEWQAREIGRRSGIAIRVHAEDSTGELPDSYRTCIFRVAQEALHNCTRHAEAHLVDVSLERTQDRVSLKVADDGHGFIPARSRGLGLLGMEERVGRLGGHLNVRSAPGNGTTVVAELPL